MSAVDKSVIITQFRATIANRYDYNVLIEQFDLPDEITPEIVAEIKAFFLGSIYPEPDKREELENAFDGLAAYIKNPRKMWGLLGNMTKAIFQFGTLFPRAFKAGLGSLEAFLSAQKFEADLSNHANKNGFSKNMSSDEFEQLIASIPRKEMEAFIADVMKLIESMVDTQLVGKAAEILDNVITTMKKKPELYPKQDVDGLSLGKGILENGVQLFSKYNDKTKKLIVKYIRKNEDQFVDYIFEKWK